MFSPVLSFLFMLLIILTFHQLCCLQEDYYWREYVGVIPSDAVIGGKNLNNEDVFIGQAYVRNTGLVVVQINSGVKEVYAPIRGIHKVNSYTKILCGPQPSFYWMPANASHLHLLLLDKHAVIGGHEDTHGYMNIGRINHQGETKIGKINSFFTENAAFYFNDRGKEVKLNSYEILMYHKVSFDVRGAFKEI